jgi:acetyl-CoA carboxylase biotin carboxyl carrier protein
MDVRSVVQGRVLEVLVSPGQNVARGAELLIVESMKMEVPVEAPAAGTIAQILVVPGEPVAEGAVVVVLG